MSVDWEKPIEVFSSYGSIYPARLVAKDRISKKGFTHLVLFRNKSEEEDIVYFNEGGYSRSGLFTVRNKVDKKTYYVRLTIPGAPSNPSYSSSRLFKSKEEIVVMYPKDMILEITEENGVPLSVKMVPPSDF